MTLPEIPDEARQAARRGFFEGHPVHAVPAGSGYTTVQGQCDAVLTAAWPHLYAVALRHAADHLDRDSNPVHAARAEGAVEDLRRWADEAEEKP